MDGGPRFSAEMAITILVAAATFAVAVVAADFLLLTSSAPDAQTVNDTLAPVRVAHNIPADIEPFALR